MIDLHPYDGVERRFRHDDGDAAARALGRSALAAVLCWPDLPATAAVAYDLSLYSGGIGIVDRLAWRVALAGLPWDAVADRLDAGDLEVVPRDPRVTWPDLAAVLDVDADGDAGGVRQAAVTFIDRQVRPFQDRPAPGHRILLGRDGSINAWLILWGGADALNGLSFAQG